MDGCLFGSIGYGQEVYYLRVWTIKPHFGVFNVYCIIIQRHTLPTLQEIISLAIYLQNKSKFDDSILLHRGVLSYHTGAGANPGYWGGGFQFREGKIKPTFP